VAIARLQFGSERTGAQMIAPPNSVYLPCSGLWVLFFIAATKLPSYAAINASGGYPGGAAWSEEPGKGKGKRQNFFLFQLSGWLNVVFLLVVAGALFVFLLSRQ